MDCSWCIGSDGFDGSDGSDGVHGCAGVVVLSGKGIKMAQVVGVQGETEKSLGTSFRMTTAPRVSDGSRSLKRVDKIAEKRGEEVPYKIDGERVEGLSYKNVGDEVAGLSRRNV